MTDRNRIHSACVLLGVVTLKAVLQYRCPGRVSCCTGRFASSACLPCHGTRRYVCVCPCTAGVLLRVFVSLVDEYGSVVCIFGICQWKFPKRGEVGMPRGSDASRRSSIESCCMSLPSVLLLGVKMTTPISCLYVR